MRKRPRDMNQLAHLIVGIATGEIEDHDPDERERNPGAVRGGKKGGAARAAKLTAQERSDAARKAAQARWNRGPQSGP